MSRQNQGTLGLYVLLTLELDRENKISLGRAAELSQTSVGTLMVFTGNYELSSSPEPSWNPALKPFNLSHPA